MSRKWEITDLDGSNRRTVTLEQYRAELAVGRNAARRLREDYAADPCRPPAQRAFAVALAAKMEEKP